MKELAEVPTMQVRPAREVILMMMTEKADCCSASVRLPAQFHWIINL
jgi:hypothetical protein